MYEAFGPKEINEVPYYSASHLLHADTHAHTELLSLCLHLLPRALILFLMRGEQINKAYYK